MRVASGVAVGAVTIGVGLMLFSAWGTRTAAGRRAFDEMAGIIPWAAGWLGTLLVVVAAGIVLVRRIRGA